MKRLILPLMMCCFLFGCLPTEAPAADPTTTWGSSTLAPVPDTQPVVVRVPADAPAELTSFELRKGPTRKQRRAMGVTFRNALKTLAEMQKAGEVEGKDSATLAAGVLNRLLDENPAAFQSTMQVAGADWAEWIEKLLALIAEWIPLILKIIALIS